MSNKLKEYISISSSEFKVFIEFYIQAINFIQQRSMHHVNKDFSFTIIKVQIDIKILIKLNA